MMKSYRLMFLILVAIVLLACQPAATPAPETRTPIAAQSMVPDTTSTVRNAWQTFSSKEGGFTLLMPGKPKEQRQPVSTAAGSIETIMYLAQVGETAFGVGYSDYPPGSTSVDPQTVLAGARDGAAKNINGTLLDQKSLELAGHPGLEIAIQMPPSAQVPGEAVYRSRMYLVGNRLYQVIYVALKKDARPEDYQKLFDSFQLDNPPAPSSSTSNSGASLKDWIEYRSDEGGFTVLLPAEPEIKTQQANTAAGTVPLTMALTEMKNYAAGVSFNDLPTKTAADPETFLAGGREGAAQNLKGKVVSEKSIKLGDYPGTEFVVETPTGLTYTARIYVVNNRLYQVLFLASKDQIEHFDVQGFFDSFTLLDK